MSISKTPKFDSALDEILKDLSPHKRSCQQCQSEFEIFAEDIDFYHKVKTPPPAQCLECRMKAKLVWRINIVPIFYKKTCSAPGHNEKVISLYSEENPLKIYDDQYYISDKWDAIEYGKEIELDNPFFAQFLEFSKLIPRQNLQRDFKSTDCEYTISGGDSKNCYYATAFYSEGIYYGWLNVSSRNCVECSQIQNCDMCFMGFYLRNCHNCNYSLDSVDCLDSSFLYDCHNCSNCFMSSNLRNKKYFFENKQLTKEEYEQKIKEIDLGDIKIAEKFWQKFNNELLPKAIHKSVNNDKVENVVGDSLVECKDCYYTFSTSGKGKSENLRYVWSFLNSSNSIDVYGAEKGNSIANSTVVLSSSEIQGSILIRNSRAIEYSIELNNCEYCFGCVGLKNKKYCIFNKQYTENEYWEKLDELKTQMLKRGEYGSFFPETINPFPYEDTNANVYYPKKGKEHILYKLDMTKEYKNIKDIDNDLLQKPQICQATGKEFKITPFELDFYRQKNLPIPVLHPVERAKNRALYQRPFKLWDVQCSNCNQPTKTVHDPAKNYIVYCEQCYQKEVI